MFLANTPQQESDKAVSPHARTSPRKSAGRASGVHRARAWQRGTEREDATLRGTNIVGKGSPQIHGTKPKGLAQTQIQLLKDDVRDNNSGETIRFMKAEKYIINNSEK